MNVMQHDTALQALTHHAQQFRWRLSVMPEDPQHSWILDETRLLETSRLLLSSEIKTKQQEVSELNSIQIPKKFYKSMVTPHLRRLRGPFVLFTRMSMDFATN
jgi:hypothetical protein